MKITKYRMDQMEEARKIQKDCIKQHLPCPPLAWWKAEIADKDGKVEERIESKCNSYTRNGLNLIAQQALYIHAQYRSTSDFADGLMSHRNRNGQIYGTTTYPLSIKQVSNIEVGNSDLPESLNSINITAISGLVGTTNTQSASFDNSTRKWNSSIQRDFANSTLEDITITEAGLFVTLTTAGNQTGSTILNTPFLVVRDVFEVPIVIPAGKTLLFTYNFELLYPE